MLKVFTFLILTLTLPGFWGQTFDPFPLAKIGSNLELNCSECQTLFETLRIFGETKFGQEIVQNLAQNICQSQDGFGNCGQFCNDLCDGLIYEFSPVIWHLSSMTNGKHFCQFLGFCHNQSILEFNQIRFKFRPKETYSIFNMNRYLSTLKVQPERVQQKPVYFLQLTDLHLDLDYTPGTAVNCGLPQCCRKEYNQTEAGKEVQLSQQFGAFNCDTPDITWTSVLDLVSDSTFKFILLTGDMPSHDIWNQSHSKNLEVITKVINDLEAKFPKTPIYYIFGNHDNYPINLCTVNPDIKTSYNAQDYFEHLSKLGWFKWLSSEAQESFLKTGQYRTVVNGTDLFLVALNSNLFASTNLWLAAQDNFQIGNLSHFLRKSFDEAGNRSIYMINHIPFYSNDFVSNVKEAYQLVAEQSNLKGIFEGHEHTDNFHLLYDSKGNPTQIAYSPPALVPGQVNPSVRVYQTQEDDWTLGDYYQYRMNLTKSNQVGHITWQLAYTARKRFGLKDMSASSWFNFVQTLNDQETFDHYLKEVYHGGLDTLENKKEVICSLLTDRADLTKSCLSSKLF